MEIENPDEKSVDSFKGEMDLVREEEEENTTTQKERLTKILENLKNSNIVEGDDNNEQQNNQVLRAGKPKVSCGGASKNTVPESFVPNFKLNERYFYQNINVNEWNEITTFIDKFISDENLNEKDLEEFFDNHPKLSKGNVLKLQGSIEDCFSKKKDLKKYKILMNYITNKYYKPKPVICECYFFPNPSNEQAVVNMFRTCKKTLDVAIFTFTRDSIAQAILEAHQRGLKIRCIGDDGNSKVKGSDVRLLASVGIPCKTDNNLRFHMHNKMAILDNSVVITGSFNWTNQAVNKNQENILFLEDKNIANQYTQYFNQLWDSFDTIITKEDAIKYIEEEKKNNKSFNNYDFVKKYTKETEIKNDKTTTNKEKTEKKAEKKEKKEKTVEKEKTSKKEKTAKKEKTTNTKEKKTTSKSKEKTTSKKKDRTTSKSKEKATSKSKERSTSKSKEKTTKEKPKGKDTKEKKSKTMKETKKSSSVKSKEKTKTKAKTTKAKTAPKTTKEKKKEKVQKAKATTTKRVRGVKSTSKSSKKAKK